MGYFLFFMLYNIIKKKYYFLIKIARRHSLWHSSEGGSIVGKFCIEFLLTIFLIILKLSGIITCSWFLVFCPLIISALFNVVIEIIFSLFS